jgi:zinc transport system substrate-binding protein
VLPDLKRHGVTIVKANDNITLLPGIPESSDNLQLSPDPSLSDPHIWLDPALAKQEVTTMKEALIKVDPTHQDTYQANADSYIKELAALDTIFTEGLKTCDQTNLVTSHAAFAYLAKHYHLTMVPIAGLSPDAEASPQRLANIATFVKDHHISYIFFESLVSPKVSQTIAQETGAKTISFNPLEGLTQMSSARA